MANREVIRRETFLFAIRHSLLAHFSYPPMRMSSSSEDDTAGTCSPSLARDTATRGLLKAVSAPAWAVRLLSSSATSTLYWPMESSTTLPGVAEVSTRLFSGGLIGARPWEKERNRRS